MKVIGHRGAAGLALENTLAGFEIATLLGVDAIELDIHCSRDGKLVVVHDPDLRRVTSDVNPLTIKGSTLAQIQAVKLKDGSKVLSLDAVFKITNPVHLIIEIKSERCLQPLIKLLKKNPKRTVTIVSFKHNELAKLRTLSPNLTIYASERTRPIDIIHLTRGLKLDGVCLNYWLLNPLTYWMCRRYNLELLVYTVNSRIIGRMIGFLYPKAMICTDYPERFMKTPYPLNAHSRKKK